MPFGRGDVYWTWLMLTDPDTGQPAPMRKMIVTLQDAHAMHPNVSNVAYVVVSTDRRAMGTDPADWEATLDENDGIPHASLVDCRWVYTSPRGDHAWDDGEYVTTLSAEKMVEISWCIWNGMQLTFDAN